jgi:hypothetical protein
MSLLLTDGDEKASFCAASTFVFGMRPIVAQIAMKIITALSSRDHRERSRPVGQVPGLPSADVFESVDIRQQNRDLRKRIRPMKLSAASTFGPPRPINVLPPIFRRAIL